MHFRIRRNDWGGCGSNAGGGALGVAATFFLDSDIALLRGSILYPF